ncbi:hypothetical protein TNCV_514661 [Trichonephila clavipes]|nr:hypothetical protein TNCV_514661 [Trichonephila clavipes]
MAVLSAGSRPPSGHAPVVRADDVEYTLAYLKRHPSPYPHHHLLIKEREGVVWRLSNISYEDGIFGTVLQCFPNCGTRTPGKSLVRVRVAPEFDGYTHCTETSQGIGQMGPGPGPRPQWVPRLSLNKTTI